MSASWRALGIAVAAAAFALSALAPSPRAEAGGFKKDDEAEKFDPNAGGTARQAFVAYHEKRDFKKARELFQKAIDEGQNPDECHGYLARIAFFYAEDDVAREHLAKIQQKTRYDLNLETMLDGPYRKVLGDAQKICEGKTPKGHYYLVTDIGFDKKEWETLRPQVEAAEKKGNKKALALLKSEGWKEVAGFCDAIYDEYNRVFPFPKDEKLVSRVFVLRERGDYLDYGVALGNEREWLEKTGGYYTPFSRLLMVSASERGKKFKHMWQTGREVLFHEAFHQYLDYYVEDAPKWFNEGIARYFEDFTEDPKSGKLQLGPVRKENDGTGMTDFQVMIGAFKPTAKDPVVPLKQFTAGDTPDFYEKEKMYIRYAQAWSVVRFFVDGYSPRSAPNKGRKILLEYFKALKAGKNGIEAQAAAFKGEDFDKLEKYWRTYFQGL